MKSSLLKNLPLLLIAPIVLLSFMPSPDHTDFSGQWKLNESKSDFGQFGPRFAAKSIQIQQTADSVTFVKNVTTFNGDDVTRTETLSFDGKETESAMGFGNSKKKSTAKWSDDGKTLFVSYTLYLDFNGQTNEVPGTETWTKSEDGKSISLKTESSGPQGEFSTTAVYDKE